MQVSEFFLEKLKESREKKSSAEEEVSRCKNELQTAKGHSKRITEERDSIKEQLQVMMCIFYKRFFLQAKSFCRIFFLVLGRGRHEKLYQSNF